MSARRNRRRNRKKGFTLVEMLVTVVVLAILASISIKVIEAKEKAYVAVMISNLRILVLAQAAYFDENYQYAAAVARLEVNIAPDVRLLMLGGPRGFTARAMHPQVTHWCAVFLGNPFPDPIYRPAIDEGVIKCSPSGGGGGGGGPKGKG